MFSNTKGENKNPPPLFFLQAETGVTFSSAYTVVKPVQGAEMTATVPRVIYFGPRTTEQDMRKM